MLEELASKHKLWLSFLHKFGCDNSIAEDMVQDMYIRLHERVKDVDKILVNGSIKTYFVYVVLRNMYISHIRKDKSVMFPYLDFDIQDSSENVSDKELESSYFYYLKDKLQETLKTLSRHERLMYDLHFVKGKTQREIARESGAGLSHVNNTCKNIKRVLRAALMEDLEDYYNEDYNLKF